MKRKIFFFATIFVFGTLALHSSHQMGWAAGEGEGERAEMGAEKVTVVGEVIDPVCYIRHGSRGMEHKKCAEYCASLGVTLAILNEENGEILTAFPTGHANPNEKLIDYVAQRVKVTGIIYENGGLKGIEVVSVEPVDSK